MIKAFFDTNVLLSAIIKPEGSAGILLQLASVRVFELLISDPLINELSEVLGRPRVHKALILRYSKEEIDELPKVMAQAFNNVGELCSSGIEPIDPKDAHIIDAAMTGGVEYLVSGDKKHVLMLKGNSKVRRLGLRIVTVKEFTEILAAYKK